MIKVYEPIRDQAIAERIAAEAQSTVAEAAKKQADNAERALALGQRAWVGASNASLSAEPEVGKPIEVVVQYQNTGREPALGFVYGLNVESVLNSEEIRGVTPPEIESFMAACRNLQEWRGGQVVYPSVFSNYSLASKTSASVADRGVTSGKKLVIVQGCFHYRTVSSPKYSYFCYFYKKGFTKIQNLNICASGHDAD